MVQKLTDSALTLSQRMFDILTANAAALGLNAGGEVNVWYGDQDSIPRTPAVCVEPGTKRRTLAGVPDMTELNLDVHLLVYHNAIAEQQASRKFCIQIAEGIEQFLHINHLNMVNSLGEQIIVHGLVTEFDPGYVYKQGTLNHSVHMIWTALSKTSLRNPLNPIP